MPKLAALASALLLMAGPALAAPFPVHVHHRLDAAGEEVVERGEVAAVVGGGGGLGEGHTRRNIKPAVATGGEGQVAAGGEGVFKNTKSTTAEHYLRVAAVNGLDDVRMLEVGRELIFPPYDQGGR
mgnify:CR=1 FL=1